MTLLIVDLIGIVLIGFIIWWFWFSMPVPRSASSGLTDIVVENGVYTPAVIEVAIAKPVTLRFVRKDPSPCAEKVIFSDLGISQDLALDIPAEVSVTVSKPGEYEFTCQMGMYRGKLIAR
ncbi:MAG: cupredoxin domain-containing protein [Gammaproteobacteria bacterium]|nr:cupredoxin domain-containing protein [Gammaproteobacteria bacterium]